MYVKRDSYTLSIDRIYKSLFTSIDRLYTSLFPYI